MDHSILNERAETFTDTRRHPRVQVPAPFSCSLVRSGPSRWFSRESRGIGVVFDVSMAGAKVMTETDIKPGDHLRVSLHLPRQVSPMQIELATVRWANGQTFGLEFLAVASELEWRLRKFLTYAAVPAKLFR